MSRAWSDGRARRWDQVDAMESPVGFRGGVWMGSDGRDGEPWGIQGCFPQGRGRAIRAIRGLIGWAQIEEGSQKVSPCHRR